MNIKLATKEAKKSEFKRARMGAVLTKGSKILGVGYNQINRYQGKIRTASFPGSLHSEVACILDALRKYSAKDIAGSTMTVVRLGAGDHLRLALPCEACYNVLQNMGIKVVRFSTNEGIFSEIRL